jgi:hypothetical protein
MILPYTRFVGQSIDAKELPTITFKLDGRVVADSIFMLGVFTCIYDHNNYELYYAMSFLRRVKNIMVVSDNLEV